MKTHRKLDELGRILLPPHFLSEIGAGPNASLRITMEGGRILLEKVEPCCKLCGEVSDLEDCGGVLLCQQCLQKIKAYEPDGR